ncbi:Putative glycosyltransferase EpsE [Pirellulimonas nuda]|uniref:Glycosyltransferase EpsE n=1 Tax=Pirellulimonas nuda TaxID=2528009 RepID=A0A518DIC9_9BACT|nr:glycosyltransferase [Pirellulimonas nuda]QDU91236.1 Putative glycosyltransferase EpsE [Pirellulimonas nuda]
MDTKLSIVLPVYNAERSLRQQVESVLEQAGELTPRFEVLIVDDGSTDDTFDIANELSAQYVQVAVVRQPQRHGLGAVIRRVRRRLAGRWVVLHDGVSPLEAGQIRRLWEERFGAEQVPADQNAAAELRRAVATHAAVAAAHSRLAGFQWMSGDEATDEAAGLTRADSSSPRERRRSVGQIPTLPRPRLMSSLSDFAIGE